MVINDTLKEVERLYTDNWNEHGSSSKSVGWPDSQSHILRFDKLAELIRVPKNTKISVNDFGCGYAEMFHYLDRQPDYKLEKYYGYDISEKMLDAAKGNVKDSRIELLKSSEVTRVADYSFVSGTYNVRFKSSDTEWREFILKSLNNLKAHSAKGMAFNLLSTHVDWKKEDLFYADPIFFFDYCKRNLSKKVSLLHDYPLFEWTILVRF